MGKTKIEWTDSSWQTVAGCARISSGCGDSSGGGCYAERMTHRLGGNPKTPQYHGLTRLTPNGPRYTGKVRLLTGNLDEPLRWRKPRRVFVNSMSDLFHKDVPNEYIAAVFGVMAATPQHTYQILTKRADRMVEWFEWAKEQDGLHFTGGAIMMTYASKAFRDAGLTSGAHMGAVNAWPLPNVWIGVSVENQEAADERIPLLLQVPAAVRWVSAEPLLGPVDLCGGAFGPNWLEGWDVEPAHATGCDGSCVACPEAVKVRTSAISWCVAGGESGPGARPMHPERAQSLRDQCVAAGVPFFFKGWGEWLPLTQGWRAGVVGHIGADQKPTHVRCGKKKAGRELDGRTWSEMPEEAGK